MSRDISFLKNKNKISFTTYDNICATCNTYNYPWINNCINCNKTLNIQLLNVFNSNEYQRKSNAEVYKYFIKKYNINTNIILDLGCSYGSWFDRYKNMGFKIIYGIDVNDTVLEYANKIYNKCVIGTAIDIVKNFGYQDIIACNAVIIHIKEESEIIKLFTDVYNSLNINGYFIVSLPNSHNIPYSNDIVFNYKINYYEYIILQVGFKIIEKLGTFTYKNKSEIMNNNIDINKVIMNENSTRNNIDLYDEVLYLLLHS